MTQDPEVEAGAMALAWAARLPAFFKSAPADTAQNKLTWWQLMSEREQELYRYRASIVLEAVDELRSKLRAILEKQETENAH